MKNAGLFRITLANHHNTLCCLYTAFSLPIVQCVNITNYVVGLLVPDLIKVNKTFNGHRYTEKLVHNCAYARGVIFPHSRESEFWWLLNSNSFSWCHMFWPINVFSLTLHIGFMGQLSCPVQLHTLPFCIHSISLSINPRRLLQNPYCDY